MLKDSYKMNTKQLYYASATLSTQCLTETLGIIEYETYFDLNTSSFKYYEFYLISFNIRTAKRKRMLSVM